MSANTVVTSMPAFLFFCSSCVYRFEKIVSSNVDKYPCPDCGGSCVRTLEGQSFAHAFEEPAVPTNSGVTDYDHPSADKAVGRDADKKWEELTERKKFKEKLRANSGTHALQRTAMEAGNHFRALSKEEYANRVQVGKELVRKYNEQEKERASR